jgi:Protein of unknown function (DUF4054)
MADIVTFITQFPEFSAIAGSAQLQAFLNAAALEIDLNIWGLTADQGTYYLMAHRLCCSPFGQNAKMMVDKKAQGYGRTTYGQSYKELQIQVSSGYRVC